VYASDSGAFALISYPIIPGIHVPRTIGHLLGLLRAVQGLHKDQGVIHGDLRWLNVVVPASSNDAVCLIDFDLAGIGDQSIAEQRFRGHLTEAQITELCHKKYPPTLTVDLQDGKRHPEARGGAALRFAHDLYGCGGLLSFVSSSSEAVQRAIQNVAQGLMNAEQPLSLSSAIEQLSHACNPTEVVSLSCRLPENGLETGSPNRASPLAGIFGAASCSTRSASASSGSPRASQSSPTS